MSALEDMRREVEMLGQRLADAEDDEADAIRLRMMVDVMLSDAIEDLAAAEVEAESEAKS